MRRTTIACGSLAVASMAWAVAGGLGGAEGLWVHGLGAPPSRIWPVTEGIWAGTMAGKWLMLAGVAAVVRRRSLAVLLGIDVLAGVLLPLTADLRGGGGLSPWLVLAVLDGLPPLLVLAVACTDGPGPRPTRCGRAPGLVLACGCFVLMGLVIVLGFHAPVFAAYRQALRGLDPSPPWSLVALAYARIAVGFGVHYAALAVALRQRGPARALLVAAAVAQLAWMITDSTTGLVHDAAFNVLVVNLPACGLFGLAWWRAWRVA